MNILLVYPRNPDSFWSFKHVLKFVSRKSAFPPLGLLTVAAMLPRAWNLRLVDLNVRPLADGDIRWADYVFLSGMIVHKVSAHEIAARCAALGKSVVAGGPLFTTGHAEFPEIRHFVLGEAENLAARLAADIERGVLEPFYPAPQRPAQWPDIRGTPVPRTKEPAQVVRELEALRERGWRDMVFIVDDNFIGNRKRTRELLRELVGWRARTNPTMGFFTEASVNLADDAELCELMVQAGFKKVFLGIETPSPAGLEECNKRQNQARDLGDAVRTIQRAGMEVMGGFIVGFDSDPMDIFRRQFEFIQRAGVVTAMVGLLSALPQTALYRRLAAEGRILSETCGNNTDAAINFATRLDPEFLRSGYRELMRRLYEPANYYRRIRTFLRSYRPRGPSARLSGADVRAFLRSLWVLGIRHAGRGPFWLLLWTTLLASPRKFRAAMELSILGHHFRRVANSL